jgi:hypothetical protein
MGVQFRSQTKVGGYSDVSGGDDFPMRDFEMCDMGNRVKDDGTFKARVHLALFLPQ